MQIDELLGRLDRARKTGPDTWHACCPAHDDRSPSLSIKDAGDGRILIHCFGGCSVHDVVGAMGLEISDLFPPRQHHGKPQRRPFPAMDALRAVSLEVLLVAIVAKRMMGGESPNQTEFERLMLASERIGDALYAVAPQLRGVRQ